ncbi:hypothetical protein C1893_22930 [Pseudomonas sp. MPR-ANC1]|uniref:hypothetical protein n=1 Tax=Pseudomonas sp. MPR-ANC1 TaxID=2075548 RepID=UPI000CD27E27|nr:hypothetical protein [Pseudomonas sp. MPR-ANC1]POA45952.1 hypothetical protein C1893_22930 [Pseudomonas sp. MPR-ANC1]
MLIREFCVVVGLFILTILLSALYGALLVHNLGKVFPLDGVVKKVVLGFVFLGMLFVNFRYFFVEQLAESLGRDTKVEKTPVIVGYLYIFISALFCAEVIVQFIAQIVGEGFGFTDLYRGVIGVVAFVIISIWFWLRTEL